MVFGLSAFAQPVTVNFENMTGQSSSQIWVQFLGGDQVAGTYGNGNQLYSNTAYSIDQLNGTLDLTGFSGRVYISYGAYGLQGMENPLYTPSAQTTTDVNYNTRYQYFEPTIIPSGGGSGNTFYGDLSYIDFTSISLSMQLKQGGTVVSGTVVPNSNQVSSNAQKLVNQASSSALLPNQAILPAGASSVLPNSTFTRVISPQFTSGTGANAVYPEFTNYLESLDTKTTLIAGTFVGTGAAQPSGNQVTTAQTYYYTATFYSSTTGDPGDGYVEFVANTELNGQVSASWLPEQVQNGSPGIGGTSTIRINYSDLLVPKGIYGNDPAFTVVTGVNSGTYSSITNDIYGRVVGDLLAGLSLGYIGSEVEVNGVKIGDMASSYWWASGEANTGITYIPSGTNAGGQLVADEVLWAQTPAGQGYQFGNTRVWDGHPDDNFYNVYAAALALTDPATGQPYTTGYGFPLQDRLGNNLLSFGTADPRLVGAYLQITINPDGSTGLPTGIWSGSGGGDWGTATNWSGTVVPAGNASVQFSGSNGGTIDTGANRSTAGIYFNYYAGQYVITSNTITLSGNIVNSSQVTQKITSDLVLGSDATIFPAFGDLEIEGDIALSNSSTANTLTFDGRKMATVDGVISDGTAPGGIVTKLSSGTLVLNGDNTFTGGLNHEDGTLVLGHDNAAGTGTLALSSGSAKATILQAGNGDRTFQNAVNLNGDVAMTGTNGLTFDGDVTITGSSAVARQVTNTTDVTFNGAIGEETAGSSITKAGSGTMTLGGTAANTFTGTLAVNDGTLILNKTAGVKAYGDLTAGDGKGATGSSVIQWNASNQGAPGGASNVIVNTDGQLNLQSFDDTISSLTMSGGSVVGTGTLTVGAGASAGTVSFIGTGSSAATIGTNLSVGPSTTFLVNNTFAEAELTISGVVTGSNVTKSGGGVLVTENNAMTGNVTITKGILATNSMATANVNIVGGALSSLTSSTAVQTMDVQSLEVSVAGGGFVLGLGAGTASDSINITGTTGASANFATGAPVVFYFSDKGMSGDGPVTFNILTSNISAWADGNTPDPASLMALSMDISGLTGSFAYSSTTGVLTFTGQRGVSGTWASNAISSDWSNSSNWAGAETPAAGANIVFGASTEADVVTSSTHSIGSLTFTSASPAYNLSGQSIILSGSLTNASTNTQTIANTLLINGNRTVDAAAGDIVLGDISLSPTGILPGTATFTGSATTTVGGSIQDGLATGGNVVMQGTGTLVLSGSNGFTGALVLESGVVEIGQTNSLGYNNLLDFSGGTLRTTSSLTISQQYDLVLSATSGFDVSGAGNTLSVATQISGSGGLVKSGDGTLALAYVGPGMDNTYAGGTVINDGILSISYNNALGLPGVGVTVNSGTLALVTAAQELNIQDQTLTLSGTDDSALQALAGNTATWSGSIGLTGNASIEAAAGAQLTLARQVNTGTNTLTINSSGSASGESAANIIVSGNLVGSGTVNKTGAGVFTASGVSGTAGSFTGQINVQEGNISLLSNQALGSGSSSILVADNATLQFGSQGNGGMQVNFETITISGSGVGSSMMGAINNLAANKTTLGGNVVLADDALLYSQTGQIELTGPIDLADNTLTITSQSASVILSGAISGSGGLTTFSKGTVELSGTNTYSGPTTIGAGTGVTVKSSSALGTGTATVASGASLNLSGSASVISGTNTLHIAGDGVGGFGALNNVSGTNTWSGNIILDNSALVQSSSGSLILSGTVSGSGILSIVGSGTGVGGGEVYLSGETTLSQINITSGIFGADDLTGVTLIIGSGTTGAIPAIFSPGGTGTIETVNVGNIVPGNNGMLLIDVSGTSSDQIISSTAPGLNDPTILVNNLGITGTSNTYTILSLSATTAGAIAFTGPGTVLMSGTGATGAYNSYLATGTNGSGLATSLQLTINEGAAVWNDQSGDGQWGTAANWETASPEGAYVPVGGSFVAFSATTATTVQTGVDQTVSGLNFVAGSAAVEIAGNTINTYGDIVNESSVEQTISSNVTLKRNASVNAQDGDMLLSGTVHLGSSGSSHTLMVTGDNDTTISGNITGGTGGLLALVKSGSGSLTVSGSTSYAGVTHVEGGTFYLDGSLGSSNVVAVDVAGTLAGSGTSAGSVVVAGTLSPGNSPGNLTTGSQTWLDGGNYNWQIHDATGLAGTGTDLVTITGQLDLSGLSEDSFHINIWSLMSVSPDANGDAMNFDETQDYTWMLVATSAGISGFSASDFVIHTEAFNGTGGFANGFSGTFSVSVSGNNLVLEYNAVPEPSTWALLGLGAVVAFVAVRRRKVA